MLFWSGSHWGTTAADVDVLPSSPQPPTRTAANIMANKPATIAMFRLFIIALSF